MIATTALSRERSPMPEATTVRMMILLLHTVAAFSPAASAHRRVHPCTRATCSRRRACGALASGGGDAGNDLGAYWDKATGIMRAFRVPRLKDDDLPEAAALSAQIELVAVKFSGVCSTTAQTTACFRMTLGCLPPPRLGCRTRGEIAYPRGTGFRRIPQDARCNHSSRLHSAGEEGASP